MSNISISQNNFIELFSSEIFLGAFLGSFVAFCFYLLGQFIIRTIPNWHQKRKLKRNLTKIVNHFYRLILLRNQIESIFYDLMEIFRTGMLDTILKGDTSSSIGAIDFRNNLYEIVIIIKGFESRFTIKNLENQYYVLRVNREDSNEIEILVDFIQFFEGNCFDLGIKLNLTEEMNIARNNLIK